MLMNLFERIGLVMAPSVNVAEAGVLAERMIASEEAGRRADGFLLAAVRDYCEGRFVEAEAAARQSLELRTSGHALAIRALAQLKSADGAKEAWALMCCALPFAPGLGAFYLAMAEQAEVRSPDMVETILRRGTEVSGDWPPLSERLVNHLVARGAIREAREIAQRLATIHPSPLHHKTHASLCHALGLFEEGIASALRAIETEKTDGKIFNLLGRLYLGLAEYAKAAGAFEGALATCPPDPTAIEEFVEANVLCGRRERARELRGHIADARRQRAAGMDESEPPSTVSAGEGEPPFTIFALCLDNAFGDFAVRLVYAASVKLLFGNARLHVCYRDNRPYKRFMVSMCPHIDESIVLPADAPRLPFEPLEDLNSGVPAPNLAGAFARLDRLGADLAHLVLTPAEMPMYQISSFPVVGYLEFPIGEVGQCHERLLGLGLDENRWICCIHYRERSYQYRNFKSQQNSDPEIFIELMSTIIDEMGGQVIRVGHPGMYTFPKKPGFIDISGVDGGVSLQAYSIARSRFCLMGISGPSALCGAMDIPIGRVNATMIGAGPNPDGVILLQRVFTPSGKPVPREVALAKRMYEEAWPEYEARGYWMEPNSTAEIIEVARIMYRETTSCPGLRPLRPPVRNPDPSNVYSVPRPENDWNRYVDFSPSSLEATRIFRRS